MRRLSRRGIVLVSAAVAIIAIAGAWLRAQDRVLMGYSPASSAIELAAEPHHLGSDRQRQLSLWLQGKLRSYGLDAQIERFDVRG